MKLFFFYFLFLFFVFIGCTFNENDYEIYDVHEQIATLDQVPRFLVAMDRSKVDKIILLGSPEATFIYKQGFKNHHENNKELMKIAARYPNRFIVFPTIDPRDTNELIKFKSYIEQGAKGLRLFSGQYAWFYKHIGPVNRTELYPLLQYCQDNNIPVMYNMNPSKEDLQQQFEDILMKYPKLKVICPHFCLSTIKSERFEYLMDTYPLLYTDISFGHFFEEGLRRISKNPPKFKKLFEKYADRILFGTDMVITNKTIPKNKDISEWMYNLTMCYRDMIEKKNYNCVVKIKKVFNVSMINLSGLNLNEEILKKIYYSNPRKFLGID